MADPVRTSLNSIIEGDNKKAPNSFQIYICAGNGPLMLGVFFIFSGSKKEIKFKFLQIVAPAGKS